MWYMTLLFEGSCKSRLMNLWLHTIRTEPLKQEKMCSLLGMYLFNNEIIIIIIIIIIMIIIIQIAIIMASLNRRNYANSTILVLKQF